MMLPRQWRTCERKSLRRRDGDRVSSGRKVREVVVSVLPGCALSGRSITNDLDARPGNAAVIPTAERDKIVFDAPDVTENANAPWWSRDLLEKRQVRRGVLRQLRAATHVGRQPTARQRARIYDVALANAKCVAAVDAILRRRFHHDGFGIDTSPTLFDREPDGKNTWTVWYGSDLCDSSSKHRRYLPELTTSGPGRGTGTRIDWRCVEHAHDRKGDNNCACHPMILTPGERFRMCAVRIRSSASL
jgi:hypothetical protein